MTERWLPIPEWEGIYEVSDLGQVRSLDRVVTRSDGLRMPRTGNIMRPTLDRHGYPCIQLSAQGRCQRRGVHQLVLAAFVGPRPSGMVSRHLNGNSEDPRLVNLCYGTPRENNLDAVRHGTNANTRKTHCTNGHALTEENVRWWWTGTGMRRYCRACQCINSRAYAARKKAAGRGSE